MDRASIAGDAGASQSIGAMIGSLTFVLFLAIAVTSIDSVKKAMPARARGNGYT